MKEQYNIEDLEIFYNAKTLFYEIGYDGQPIKHPDIVGDNHGDLLHIGIRDDEYNICYYIFVDDGEVEECVAGQKFLLKALNNGNIEPIESGIDVENVFNSLNESTDGYQPKLYLRFEPPIYNDALGIRQLDKILNLIEDEYPEVSWWEGQSPTEHNPFNENEDVPDQVASLTIGYWSDEPNRLTYGHWDANDMGYTNAIDGWQFLKDREVDYDKTSDLFNTLNESFHQPKLNLRFEPPIYNENELDKVLQVLETVYPGLKWKGDDLVSKHNVIRDSGDNDFEYEPIYYLTIGFFSHATDRLTYTSAPDDESEIADDEHSNFNWVDGWQWVRDNEIDYDKTTNIFNQLNESVQESTLTLVFDPPIEDPRTMEIVLMKLQTIHPDWTWVNKKRLIDYNPFGKEIQYSNYDGMYDNVVGTLTFNHPEWENIKGLSWGSNDTDEPYVADVPEYDGWEYIENLGDIPSTEDIFNQLN